MISAHQREMLLDIAAECEARAEKAATEMLAHRRRMLLLRQRAALLRDMAGAEPDRPEASATP
jgi:hypothetical protein